MPETGGLWLPDHDWGAVRDQMGGLDQRVRDLELPGPHCLLVNGIARTIPINAATLVQWDSEQIDTANMHDPGDNTKIRVRVAGLYFVYSKIVFNVVAAGGYWTIRSEILYNGAAGLADAPATVVLGHPVGFPFVAACHGLKRAYPGDYFQVTAFQNAYAGGANLTGSAGADNCHFGCFRVAA